MLDDGAQTSGGAPLGLGVDLAREVVKLALAAGAAEADSLVVEETGFDAIVRGQIVESVRRAAERRIGVRVFLAGGRVACASTADPSRASVARIVEAAVALAREASEDPCGGLPPATTAGPAACSSEELDIDDPEGATLDPGRRIDLALRAEAAARSADPRIVNSEGTEWADGLSHVAHATSTGTAGEYRATHFGLTSMPIAEQDGERQTSYWFTATRQLSAAESPESVGTKAARRALARLGSRKIRTCRVPVVFDPETASSLLRSLASACSGPLLVAGTSFLAGRLGARIGSGLLDVVDDATVRGGLGSRPFDAEGVPARRSIVVEKGTLTSYLLDAYYARRLGLATTGSAHARPGEAVGVAPTNFRQRPGPSTPEEILRGVDEGLLVTELIGFGVNLVTGDYSRGAAGFWIARGEIAYPVHEVTIAGNLKEMLLGIEGVGNDPPPGRAVASPTLRISGMTVAGT